MCRTFLSAPVKCRWRALLTWPLAALGLGGTAATAAVAERFECRWADRPPIIDGKLDDAVWRQAQVVENFRASWLPEGRRKPPTATKARLLWDREYLYFSADLEDTDVFANITEQDGAIWTCDVFELFFKPALDKPGYYEFEVNAGNGKLDMFLPSRGAGGYSRFKSDREFHLESAVSVRGTLNNFSDQDRGWTVEGRIPWRDFLPTGGRPVPGETWRHSLCRYDYSAGFAEPALSTNTDLTEPNFHRYEDYVPLTFIGPAGTSATGTPRVPWEGSRLVGSPEPPPRFQDAPAFAQLQTKQPLVLVPEPGRASFILVECNGYAPIRNARICRLPDDAAATQPDLLLELEESVYDVCFHPKFAENGYLYLGTNGRFGPGKEEFNSRVVRYTMDQAGRIDAASRLVIIEWHSQGHNGGALTFGQDGMLYTTSGDGTSDSDGWSSGQDLTRLLAKVLRLDVDRPEGGRAYRVPPDNPFISTPGARPETWAYGFRNPWRITLDRQTGELWVGENGQDVWEYARIVRRGENYGWPIMEGSHPFHQHRPRGPTPFTAPLIEHPHTDFRSLTGGIVYYGKKFPELVGRYIYGDHSTGQIWAVQQRGGKILEQAMIADTTLGITAFCESPAGDILVVDYLGNAIRKLVPGIPAAAAPFPAKLSDTGLFTNTAALQRHPALIPYAVNVNGWHDGATSERAIALPGLERMEVKDQGGWNFPDGAAIVQTLTLKERRMETRVLLKQQNEWAAYSYAWNEAQTDATLVSSAGEDRKLANGQTWRIPGKQECMLCHSRAANFVLGLSTLQLNRGDQLTRWEHYGVLRVNRGAHEESEWRRELAAKGREDKALLALVQPSSRQRPSPTDSPLLPLAAEKLPRLTDPADTTAALNDRARSYLHANCSHCHSRNAGGNSLMQLAVTIPEKEMGLWNETPMHATFGVPDAKLVVPGAPDRSLLVYRPVLRGAGQMPPVGSNIPDGAGMALLAQWITQLPAQPAASPPLPTP
ncbi:MAG: hypothetical protein RIQ93_69 [Verrucomicrobiota bacterium]